MPIGVYSIDAYCGYFKLNHHRLLMDFSGYYINNIILMAIGGYFINGYW